MTPDEKADKLASATDQGAEVTAAIRNKIKAALTDDLRKPEYQGHENPLYGHCYVASEAYFHAMGGKDAGFTAMRISHEGTTHWWVREKVVLYTPWGKRRVVYKTHDLTAKQFQFSVPYWDGIPAGFLTREPSKRARILLERIDT